LEGVLRGVDEELEMECTNGYGPVECYCDVEGEYSFSRGNVVNGG